MPVSQEEHAEGISTAQHAELQRLSNHETGEEAMKMFGHFAGLAPLEVVVAPEAFVAFVGVELTLELEDVRVCGEDVLRSGLPGLLDVAEHEETKPVFEVVGERGRIRSLAAAEVVGAVAGALVVVGEDDEPSRVEVDLLLFRVVVVEDRGQGLRDASL